MAPDVSVGKATTDFLVNTCLGRVVPVPAPLSTPIPDRQIMVSEERQLKESRAPQTTTPAPAPPPVDHTEVDDEASSPEEDMPEYDTDATMPRSSPGPEKPSTLPRRKLVTSKGTRHPTTGILSRSPLGVLARTRSHDREIQALREMAALEEREMDRKAQMLVLYDREREKKMQMISLDEQEKILKMQIISLDEEAARNKKDSDDQERERKMQLISLDEEAARNKKDSDDQERERKMQLISLDEEAARKKVESEARLAVMGDEARRKNEEEHVRDMARTEERQIALNRTGAVEARNRSIAAKADAEAHRRKMDAIERERSAAAAVRARGANADRGGGGRRTPEASVAEIFNKITANQWLQRNRPGSTVSPRDLGTAVSSMYFDAHGRLPPWRRGGDGVERNYYGAEEEHMLVGSFDRLNIDQP